MRLIVAATFHSCSNMCVCMGSCDCFLAHFIDLFAASFIYAFVCDLLLEVLPSLLVASFITAVVAAVRNRLATFLFFHESCTGLMVLTVVNRVVTD